MGSLIIKTSVHGSTVTATIGDQRVAPGDNNNASLQIRRINKIPKGVSNDRVLTAFKNTVDATAYGKGGQRLEFDYDELGAGKLIK